MTRQTYRVLPGNQPNDLQLCEAAMEKRQSRSLTKPIPRVSDAPYVSPIKLAKAPAKQQKLSREEISRCISIWAQV